MTPEEEAREVIDAALIAAGWLVQDVDYVNLDAGLGVAVSEAPTKNGPADYLLYGGGKAAGAIEAKKRGVTLSGVEVQFEKYTRGLPPICRPTSGRCRSATSRPASRPSS